MKPYLASEWQLGAAPRHSQAKDQEAEYGSIMPA